MVQKKEEKARKEREYNREWSKRNKERVSSRRKELYQINKDKINLQGKAYREKNKDKKILSNKKYYLKNKTKLSKQKREYHKKQQNNFVNTYKKGKSCALCGYNEHCEILQFHHKDKANKSFEITLSQVPKRKDDEIKSEINKCILICPNCHFILHYRERGGCLNEQRG